MRSIHDEGAVHHRPQAGTVHSAPPRLTEATPYNNICR
jgi:hypothetical protein